MERLPSAMIRSGSTSSLVPRPVHSVHAPKGELNENERGSSSSNDRSSYVHARCSEKTRSRCGSSSGKSTNSKVSNPPATANQRREHLEPGALFELEDPIDDLLGGLPRDGPTADRAVRMPDARVQQPQVVVDLGDRADRRSRVAVCRLLVDRDRRRETLDEVDVGLVHLPKELPGIGRQRLDVASLTLGEDRVEGEARLS